MLGFNRLHLNKEKTLCPHSCGGGMCPTWAQAASGWLSAQQQDSSALHEGWQKLPPGGGVLQEGPGAGAGHGDKVSDACVTASPHTSQQNSKQSNKACLIV